MARNFSALNPANQFNYYNGYGFYNQSGGGVGGTQTLHFADGKSVQQMERFSNVYYNLLGFDFRIDAEFSDSAPGGTVNISETGTVSLNGFSEIYVQAPWIGTGQDAELGYKVSPYGDDQGDPFIRYAWNSKGDLQIGFLDYQDNQYGDSVFNAYGNNYFREGNDVTPGNGHRNLHFATLAGSIQNSLTTYNSIMNLHWRNRSGPFGFIKMGIVFTGGIDEFNDVNENTYYSINYKSYSTNIANVPCFVTSYVIGYQDDYSSSNGDTYSSSVFRSGATESRTVKFSESYYSPPFTASDGTQVPAYSADAFVRLKTTGLRWANYE